MGERSSGCVREGCSAPHKARGLCSKHYQTWCRKNRGRLATDTAERQVVLASGCTVEGCGHPIRCRGMCRVHYQQWWRTGDPVHAKRPSGCAVDNCQEPHHCRGWCATHYSRWQYAGDPIKQSMLIACEACPTLFVRPAGGITKRCDPCRATLQLAAARASGKRRRQQPEHRAQVRARRQAASKPCLICQGKIEQGDQPGALRQFCSDECREAYQEQWQFAWRVRNRDKLQARQHRRRARKYGANYESFKPSEIFERDGWRCYLCGEAIDSGLDYPHPRRVVLEHVIPLDRGGHHTRANTRAAHSLCNNIKGVRLPSELSRSDNDLVVV